MTENAARQIRRATPADRQGFYDICLRTADSGTDASALYGDPEVPGTIWAVPYGVLAPDFAFVLAQDDKLLGYVVAAPDTAAFDEQLERDWWPEARARFAGLVPKTEIEASALARIRTPERHDMSLLADYPAHLHINLLPEAQSGGWGRKLIETELDALRKAGVKGVHLGVSPANDRAKGFYRHLGFTDISRDGHVTFAMALAAPR